MTDERFIQMGGTIEKGPKELFLESFEAYLDELETTAREKYAINVTKAEFKVAARSKLSDALIAWAKGKGVPDSIIDEVKYEIITKIADASRIGLTFDDLFSN